MTLAPVLLFLGQAIVLIVLPYLLWRTVAVRRVVPLVVIQILTGIALGPSLFGAVAPETFRVVFTPESMARLAGLAWLAAVLFAFLTGLHFDVTEIRGRGRAFLTVSIASVAVPTLLGVLAGLWMVARYPAAAGPNATPFTFACGVGICLGVTALPVLGAILRETELLREPVGRLALGCAAVNDIVLWLMLAALLAGGAAEAGLVAALRLLALAIFYFAAMELAVAPLLRHFLGHGRLGETGFVVVCAVMFGSAMATEAIGLHFIIGGFAAGAVMPKSAAQEILDRFEAFAVVVLLPFFFMLTGLRVAVEASSAAFAELAAIAVTAAILGKVAGAAIPARLMGTVWRDALRLGTLMQCKGLMEVIVLTVLLEAGVLSPMAFSALVLMALATTALTMPLTALAGRLRA